jgi:hypothetical protein
VSGLPGTLGHKGRAFAAVLEYLDWCRRCSAYLTHVGYAEQGATGGASLGACAGCGLVHEQR